MGTVLCISLALHAVVEEPFSFYMFLNFVNDGSFSIGNSKPL